MLKVLPNFIFSLDSIARPNTGLTGIRVPRLKNPPPPPA